MKKFVFIVIAMFVCSIPILAQDGEGSGFGVWGIISAALAILSTVLSVFMSKFKGKAKAFGKLGLEVVESGQAGMDLVNTVILAGEDNVVDKTEQANIKAKAIKAKEEWSDVKAAWKLLWAKN